VSSTCCDVLCQYVLWCVVSVRVVLCCVKYVLCCDVYVCVVLCCIRGTCCVVMCVYVCVCVCVLKLVHVNVCVYHQILYLCDQLYCEKKLGIKI